MIRCNLLIGIMGTATIFAWVFYSFDAQARFGVHCELTQTLPTARKLKEVQDILDKYGHKNTKPFVLRVKVVSICNHSSNSREIILTLDPIEIVSGKTSLPTAPFKIMFDRLIVNSAGPFSKEYLGTKWFLTAAKGIDFGSGRPLNENLDFQSLRFHRYLCNQPLHSKR